MKKCGMLMPVFSLPGEYGIGTFGKESYEFIDFLKKSGMSVWQTLPLGPTSYGDSPYQTLSDRSLSPYFIDLEDLSAQGLLTKAELKGAKRKTGRIDYGDLFRERFALLKTAFSRLSASDRPATGKYADYAEFMALKNVYGDLFHFPAEIKARNKAALSAFRREHKDEIAFYAFLQDTLERQFASLKDYAAKSGVQFMGDMPLYVACDSADVWTGQKNFMLGEDLRPECVAGVPPDYFSADGQLWGNPLYDYAAMKEDGYKWWKSRLSAMLRRYDLIRIDHFRGLDRFWAVPYGRKAKEGEWLAADGRNFLDPLNKRVIAEDLGVIDDGVRDLMAFTGYPGMKVLLFAFDGNGENPYLPANVGKNSVIYVGTHDNDTAYGYAFSLTKEDFAVFRKRINEVAPDGIGVSGKKDVAPVLVETAYSTKAKLAIVTLADALGLGNEYRINTPGTVGNWTVRYGKNLFSSALSDKLFALAKKYKRI